MTLLYGEQRGQAVAAGGSGGDQLGLSSPTDPSPTSPHPLTPCPTGRPAVGWGQEAQGGVPSPGPEQDPEPAVAVPRSQRGAAAPHPLGPLCN